MKVGQFLSIYKICCLFHTFTVFTFHKMYFICLFWRFGFKVHFVANHLVSQCQFTLVHVRSRSSLFSH